LQERIAGWTGTKIVIDHHLTQEDWSDLRLVDTSAAAAGEVVYDVLRRWNVSIDRGIADALYLAIITDTGWFQFSNTHPRTLRLGADLMEVGVHTDLMYQALYQNERAARVRLQTRAMQSLELLAEERLAVMTLTKADFAQTGAALPDTENLINTPLQIAQVEVSILFTDPPSDGPIRVSLRSKGQVDVARFAEEFGGGGHARAAGLKLNMALEEARQKIVAAMLSRMNP
jgi:phosphoesterase RecJ-like protein